MDTPAIFPVTTPDVPTLAIVAALLAQVPPVVASVRLVVVPAQIAKVPVIVAGDVFTVTIVVL